VDGKNCKRSGESLELTYIFKYKEYIETHSKFGCHLQDFYQTKLSKECKLDADIESKFTQKLNQSTPESKKRLKELQEKETQRAEMLEEEDEFSDH
jgi:hypothetical protein